MFMALEPPHLGSSDRDAAPSLKSDPSSALSSLDSVAWCDGEARGADTGATMSSLSSNHAGVALQHGAESLVEISLTDISLNFPTLTSLHCALLFHLERHHGVGHHRKSSCLDIACARC